MATPRVLSDRELNRALLARQLLLKRAAVTPAAAIERLAGLQAQWSPAPYVGLWSRLSAFAIEDLEQALIQRTVVKATLMRGTLHIVSAKDYPALAVATTAARPESWIPAARRIANDPQKVHRATLRYARTVRTREELATFLVTQGISAELSAAMLWWLIAAHGWLVHVPPSGTWLHRKAGDLIAADAWIRAAREPDVAAAVRHTVMRHLAAFGPATVDDIASWSSIRTPAVRSALQELGPKIRTSEAHRKTVIGKNGDVAQTILVDGSVAGTWAVTDKTGEATIAVTAFTKLAKDDAAALAEEGERLARFIAPDAKAYRVAFA